MVWYIDLIGYIGMALVIISFLFKKITWLRLFNFVGAVCCMLYGFITKTYPTAILNLILMLINMQFLIAYIIKNKKEEKRN